MATPVYLRTLGCPKNRVDSEVMLGTLSEDYVRMARAKGLHPVRIMIQYAGRNAILPNLTGFAMSLGFVVSGLLLTEVVFTYPGVGYMFLQAVNEVLHQCRQTRRRRG